MTKSDTSFSVPCRLCGGASEPAYRMSDFDLASCKSCRSVFVIQMPTNREVNKYYQGFQFQTDPKNYEKISTIAIRKWICSLIGDSGGKSMLDVGGGGGFFAKAFEDFGFGHSTYIDLDAEACRFAEEVMKLKDVHCDRVENLVERIGDKKFDFIYCRHVVEHLVDPTSLILACSNYLTEGGVFVLQCPNGASKEGLIFPRYWLKFLKRAKKANSWTALQAVAFSFGSKYGWGIDPIRHLWAITGRGVKAVFRNSKEYDVSIFSASLADSVFSPYWDPGTKGERFAGMISHAVFGSVFQGMHLVAYIKRKSK